MKMPKEKKRSLTGIQATGKKAYACMYCDATFQNPQALLMHTKYKHSDKQINKDPKKQEVETMPEKDKDLEIQKPDPLPEEPKEKKNKCVECGFEFDEFEVIDEENCCPKCKAPLEEAEEKEADEELH